MNPNKKIPDWLLKQEGITSRGWKKRKRQQAKAIIDALKEFQMGCAYTPPQNHGCFGLMQEMADSLKQAVSVRNWGR